MEDLFDAVGDPAVTELILELATLDTVGDSVREEIITEFLAESGGVELNVEFLATDGL